MSLRTVVHRATCEVRRLTLALGALLFALSAPATAHARQAPPSPPPATQPPAGKAPTKAPAMDRTSMDHSAPAGPKVKWKEMDAFHMLLMATWHAAKDKNNLEPTRQMGDKLLASAKELGASRAPAACSTPKIVKAQKSMTAGAEKLTGLIASRASDADLKTALSALHDNFEVLEEGCNTGMMMMHDK